MDFHKRETIYSALVKRCRGVRGGDIQVVSPVAGAPSAPDVLSYQVPKPDQRS